MLQWVPAPRKEGSVQSLGINSTHERRTALLAQWRNSTGLKELLVSDLQFTPKHPDRSWGPGSCPK